MTLYRPSPPPPHTLTHLLSDSEAVVLAIGCMRDLVQVQGIDPHGGAAAHVAAVAQLAVVVVAHCVHLALLCTAQSGEEGRQAAG